MGHTRSRKDKNHMEPCDRQETLAPIPCKRTHNRDDNLNQPSFIDLFGVDMKENYIWNLGSSNQE